MMVEEVKREEEVERSSYSFSSSLDLEQLLRICCPLDSGSSTAATEGTFHPAGSTEESLWGHGGFRLHLGEPV